MALEAGGFQLGGGGVLLRVIGDGRWGGAGRGGMVGGCRIYEVSEGGIFWNGAG